MIEKKTYCVKEVAAILGVSIPGAYSLVASKGFPSFRVGERRIVIPIKAFEEWFAAQTLQKGVL
jgi:excisionase family DNA binding protein